MRLVCGFSIVIVWLACFPAWLGAVDWTKYLEFADHEDPQTVMRTSVKAWTNDEKTAMWELLRTFPDKGEGLLARASTCGVIRLYRIADAKFSPEGRAEGTFFALAHHPSQGVYVHDRFFAADVRADPAHIRWTLFHEFVHLADIGPASISDSGEWSRLVDGRMRQGNANAAALPRSAPFQEVQRAASRAGVPSRYALYNRSEALAEYATAYLIEDSPNRAEDFTFPADVHDFVVTRLFSLPYVADRSYQLVHEGRNLRERARKFDEALAKANEAIQVNSQNLHAYYLRGLTYMELQKNQEAIDDLKQTLSLYATDGPYRDALHKHLGELFARVNDDTRAIEHLRQVKSASDSEALKMLSAALVRTKQFDAAIDIQNRLVALVPATDKYARALALLGRAAVKLDQEDLAAASVDLDTVVALAPNDSKLYAYRAYFWNVRGNHQQFESDLAKAIELAPRDLSLVRERGDIRQARGAHREAIADFDTLLAANKHDIKALIARGKSKLALGESDSAVADAEAVLKVFPRPVPEAVQLRVDARIAAGNREKCLAELDALIARNPGSVAWEQLRKEAVKRLDEAGATQPLVQRSNANQNAHDAEAFLLDDLTDGISAAYTTDGRFFVMGNRNQEASIWDASTGHKLRTYRGHSKGVSAVAVSPDGQILATGGGDSNVILWRLESGELLHRWSAASRGGVQSVVFSSDGKLLLTGADDFDDRTVRLWQVSTGQLVREFTGARRSHVVAFSPDGRMAAAGEAEGAVTLWEVSTGAKMHSLRGHPRRVTGLAFTPDSGKLVVAAWDDSNAENASELALWDLASVRKVRTTSDTRRRYESVAISGDGTRVFSGGRNLEAGCSEIRRWDLELEQPQTALQTARYSASALAVHPDGQRLLVTGGPPIELDSQSLEETRRFGERVDFPLTVRFLDGSRLACQFENAVVTWNLAESKPQLLVKPAPDHVFREMEVTSDGSFLWTWEIEEEGRGPSRRLVRVNLATDELQRGPAYAESSLLAMSLSRDGRSVVTGEHYTRGTTVNRGSTRVFDAASGELIRTMMAPKGVVHSAAVSADGSRIVSVCDGDNGSGAAILWDAATEREVRRLDGYSYAYSAGLSPDGKFVVIGFYKDLVVWNLETGQAGPRLSGHTSTVKVILFSRDGRRVATVGGWSDDRVLLWDSATWKPSGVLAGHSDSIRSASLSDSGQFLLTSSQDGTIRVWDAERGAELIRMVTWDAGEEWLAITPDGTFDCSPGARDRFRVRVGGGLSVQRADDAFVANWQRPGLLARTLTPRDAPGSNPAGAIAGGGVDRPAVVSSTAPSSKPAAATRRHEPGDVTTNSLGMKLTYVPSGEFQMGTRDDDDSGSDDERPRHRVRITRPFWMGTYEVTQAQYQQVMGENPSWFTTEGGGRERVAGQNTEEFPVEMIPWKRASEFCERLSELSAEKAAGRRYRLPTEAEWEYACRAGTTTPYHVGESLSGNDANVNDHYSYGRPVPGPVLDRTTKVGSYKPNAFGLFDMHGNVAEWCADWYAEDYYARSPEADPRGPDSGQLRVYRGGSWAAVSRGVSSERRPLVEAEEASPYVGFRIVSEAVGVELAVMPNQPSRSKPSASTRMPSSSLTLPPTSNDPWLHKPFMPRAEAKLMNGPQEVPPDRIRLPYVVTEINGVWLFIGKAWVQKSHLVPMEQAAEYYTGYLQIDPQSAWAHNMRGIARAQKLFDANAKAGALADFNEAIRLDPNHAAAYFNRAGVQAPYDLFADAHAGGEEELRKAVEDYSTALRIDPAYADAYLLRGLIRQQQDGNDPGNQALNDLTKAIELGLGKADLVRAYLGRGGIWMAKKQYDSALADFSEAIRLNPKYDAPYFRRAYAWQKQGNLEAAIADFTTVIGMDNADETSFLRRGKLWLEKGDRAQATADFAEAMRLSRDLATRQLGWARDSYQDKDYELAIEYYTDAILLDPQLAAAYDGRAWLLATCPDASRRNGKQAVADATKACELTAWKNAGYLDALAAAYAESAEFDQAVLWALKAIDVASNEDEKREYQERLQLYQRKQPYREE